MSGSCSLAQLDVIVVIDVVVIVVIDVLEWVVSDEIPVCAWSCACVAAGPAAEPPADVAGGGTGAAVRAPAGVGGGVEGEGRHGLSPPPG